MQYEKYAKSAILNKEAKEALHYANQILISCPDAMNFFAIKMEALILLNKIAEAIEYSTKL